MENVAPFSLALPLPPFDREGVVITLAALSHQLPSGLAGEKQK